MHMRCAWSIANQKAMIDKVGLNAEAIIPRGGLAVLMPRHPHIVGVLICSLSRWMVRALPLGRAPSM